MFVFSHTEPDCPSMKDHTNLFLDDDNLPEFVQKVVIEVS